MKYLKEYLIATDKKKEVLNPSQFYKFYKRNQRNDKVSFEIDSPALGENNFGSVIVRYKSPLKNYEILNQS